MQGPQCIAGAATEGEGAEMPKVLIPAGWLQKPCRFLVSPKSPSAAQCEECEGEFSWLGKRSRRHCMFCGYLYHSQPCTSKIQVEGEFFKQRICSRCSYYRNTAQEKLETGEEFECIGQYGGGSGGRQVELSLCEDTAELVLHWKDTEVKHTTDLAAVEVRKGFSHVHQHNMEAGAGSYEPLRSFSLFLKDSLGEQSAYHLKASSALTCQLWVEGLKAANYVYHKMIEQENAFEYYTKRDVKLPTPGLWTRRLYIPSPDPSPSPPSPLTSGDDSGLEEWEDLGSPLYTPTSLLSATSPTSLYANSSGYQSDLSLSLCSSVLQPPPQRTVHSLNFTSSCRPSRPHTAPSSTRKQWSAFSSLPPGASPNASSNTADPFSPTCPCHFRVMPSHSLNLPRNPTQDKPSSLTECCQHCKDSCRLAQEMLNF